MWVNSKVAAEILGVEYEKLKKATQRANKAGKNFCSLGCHKCHFTYTDGIGRGGKVLQIWIEDQIIDEKGVKNGAYDNSANVCGSSDRYATLSQNLGRADVRFNSGAADNGSMQREDQDKHASPSDHMHNRGDNNSDKSNECVDKAQILAYAAQHGVKAAAKFYGVNEKSVYRWRKEFNQKGAKALEDGRGAKVRADIELIKQAILTVGTAQMTSWWMEYCRRYALANGLAFDMYDLKADISRATFLRHAALISTQDYEVRAFLRGGRDTLDTNISIKRDYLGVNEEWQIDATPFDFMCLDEAGEPKRYTAVGIVDVGSGRRVYELCDSPNSYANVRLLKKAFRAMGRPGYIKGDNGKDYVGEHFQGVLKRLGVIYAKAAKFDGRGKGKIERSHKIVQDFFESLPGFIGHNVGQRSAREAQAEDKSARLSGVKTNIKNLISREAMQMMVDEWCEKFRRETSQAGAWEFDERVFGKSYERRLQAEGFSIDGLKFVSLEIYRHAKMGDVCELIQNIDDASVWHAYKDGEYLCDVINSEVAKFSAEEVKAARKEYARRVINPTKAYIRSLQNEKDAYYKGVAEAKLKEAQKGKAEVIKKDKNVVKTKIEIEAPIANSVYLPDLEDALKVLNG
ncbi:helix-turn-helix domain-containing protein [Campylobacter sp. RM9328]|uniref:helix-turn-helix domain-containing protein n=1 Tax=Campylobacter sp. RM9328 TaxID=1705720 RepID=UPI001473BA8E|nr:helix-turn-helix domain-containing protein [Campylobacter sp. RM9328]